MTEFAKIGDGEWVQPTRSGYLMACCDCGLVHRLDFRLIKYGNGKRKIRFRAYRSSLATKRLRRAMRGRVRAGNR